MEKTTALVLLFTFSSCNFRVLFLNCVNLIKSLELLQLTGHTAYDTHSSVLLLCHNNRYSVVVRSTATPSPAQSGNHQLLSPVHHDFSF